MTDKKLDVTIGSTIFEIEDYIGGNIEGQETIDRMSLTVFLRTQLNDILKAERNRVLDLVEKEVIGQDERERWVKNQLYKGQNEYRNSVKEHRNELRVSQRAAIKKIRRDE